MHYLGIDYGDRWVGLALGDDETRIASPYMTIDQTKGDFFAILKNTIHKEGIDAVVVGMPLHLGASKEQEEKTAIFIDRLRNEITIPVYEQNEQFTSKESQQYRKEGSDADEHSIAAMLILQSYLDYTLTPNP